MCLGKVGKSTLTSDQAQLVAQYVINRIVMNAFFGVSPPSFSCCGNLCRGMFFWREERSEKEGIAERPIVVSAAEKGPAKTAPPINTNTPWL